MPQAANAPKPTGSGPTAPVAQRRQRAADLWLRGVPTAQIAVALQVSEASIRRDLTAIKAELLDAHHAGLEAARARSLAVLRTVQAAAWTAFTKASASPASPAGPGYLNAILAAETQIGKIEGITQPDITNQTVNVLALSEWTAMRSALLAALQGHPEARLAVAQALAQIEAPHD